ncbi:MAG: hypothetical protein DRJ21_02040 [Candidatus Methanomethylicota archaeon]|uniref:Major facilitator superfamily (MFS) profile domain-containing protein n=1 Tax=Thermoproteota archaeon TaxID=2056631 RepID=A0A497ERY8_9CREN|nr:MAG: hypothetical protein DRJ21_02040 [Candidatus Verstraetearchaeota archaeon]
MLERLRNKFKSSIRNFLILVFRRGYASLFNYLPMQYTSLYMKTLGLSEISIGYLRSLGDAFSALTSPFLGFIADLKSLKKALMIVMLIELMAPIFYALAWDWKLLIPAVICSTLTMSLTNVVEVVYIANLLRRANRATGFSFANTISTVSSLIAPMIAAIIVEISGGITKSGLKPLFLTQLIGLLIFAPIIIIFLEDIGGRGGELNIKSEFRNMINILRGRKWLQRWIILEALGGYVWGITMPYIMIYAVIYKNATPIILGLMGTALNLASLIANMPIGKFADKIGRVKVLVAIRPLFYISMIIFLLAPNPWFLILAWTLRGLFFASISVWQTLSMELVPENERGRWSGIKGLISGLIRIPSATIGGYLWTFLGPESPFIIALLIDLFIRLPLIYMTPETLSKKEYFALYSEGS